MFVYIKNILQLLLAPSRGWEDVSVTSRDTRHLIERFMYPMMGLAAISVFMQIVYDPVWSLAGLIVNAVVVFASYFVSFYFAQVMFRTFFYRFCDSEPNDHKVTVVLAYCICLLSLATVFCNVVPVNLGLKYLLPIGVALILWKANIYLRVSEDHDLGFILFGLAVLIVPPILIQQLFESII